MPSRFRSLLGALVLVLSLVALTLPATAAPDDRLVRVGVYQNSPKISLSSSQQPEGIFPDILEEVARREGWRLEYVPGTFSQGQARLARGEIDLMPDVAYSRERARRFGFHRTPVLESWSQLYAHPNAGIQALGDLRGKRVALLRGGIQHRNFEQMMTGFGFETTIVPTESLEEAFRAVQSGAADVAVANHLFGEYYHAEYGLLRTAVVFHVAQLHFVTARGRNLDLLAAIDRRIDAWRDEPSSIYYTTLGHWMDRPPVGAVPPRLLWAVGIALGLLALAAGTILLLRQQVRARTRHLTQVNAELREAQAALLQSNSLLESAERLSRVGGWEWDLRTQTASWTDECYRIHGLARTDLPSGSLEHIERGLQCFEPATRGVVREALRCCAEQGEPCDVEGPFVSATGERLWVRATAEAVRDASGRVVAVIGNLMDVTAAKLAEEQREKLEGQLRHAAKLETIGKLAGGVAHDFNNQLTVILSYADLAAAQPDDVDLVRRSLDEVLNAGHRAAALTRQLLAFSRKQVLELAPVDLNRKATDLQKMLRRILGADIDLRLELAPGLGLTLADPGRIDQILMNLVVNARDAMPTGGRLMIETANADVGENAADAADLVPGRYVRLTVSDTGCGMDDATRAQVFEPFFTTKEPGKGTGLGLSIVYGIVKQCHGHVAVESAPGRGTTFQIWLPRHEAPAAVTEGGAGEAAGARPGGSETILVVEDEDAVRHLAADVLRSAGYEVLTAWSSDDALPAAAAHEGDIHLLLTDVVLPGMNGAALAQRLRAERPETKVLFLSGDGDVPALSEDGSDLAVPFVGKPFTAGQLTQNVRAALDGAPPPAAGAAAPVP